MGYWRDLLQFSVRLPQQLCDFPVSSRHFRTELGGLLCYVSVFQEAASMSRRIPLVILHLRLEQMTEVLFAGFEAQLYSLEEMPFLYWYTSTVILSRQAETLDELCREIHASVPGSHDGACYSLPLTRCTDLMGTPMILSGPKRGSVYSHSIYDNRCIKGDVGGCLLGTSLPFHAL